MALKLDYVLRETGTNLRRNVTLTLATVVTVFVALALVGAALLVRAGVGNATERWEGGIEFIVYMQPAATAGQIDLVRNDLEEHPQVRAFTYLDHDAAYEEFIELFSEDAPELVESITPEVLPTNFQVEPENKDAQVIEGLKQQFEQKAGVREVVAATEAIRTFQKTARVVSNWILGAAVVLGVAALLLITNTIRTAMFARRREIEVMKLVGATNWFIRVPFMLEGMVQGLVGGVLAVLSVFGLSRLFDGLGGTSGFELLASLSVDSSQVQSTSTLILVVSGLVGVIGSGVAVTRFLDV